MQFQHFLQAVRLCLKVGLSVSLQHDSYGGVMIVQKGIPQAWLRHRCVFSLQGIVVNHSHSTLFYKTAKAWKA